MPSSEETPEQSTSTSPKAPVEETQPMVPNARDRKLDSLLASNASLEEQLRQVETENAELLSKLSNPNSDVTVKKHIKLLHDYNEIRDVGLGLIGLIAENRHCSVQEVMAEFGLNPNDSN